MSISLSGRLVATVVTSIVLIALAWLLLSPPTDRPSHESNDPGPNPPAPQARQSSDRVEVPTVVGDSVENGPATVTDRGTSAPGHRAPDRRDTASCPPEGCACPASSCAEDETCFCRSDGTLLRTESVEQSADGFRLIRRVTLYDRHGDPVERQIETFRGGVLASRERTYYEDGRISHQTRDLFDASGSPLAIEESEWQDGHLRVGRHTSFGPDGQPTRVIQDEYGDDGTVTTGYDNDGDGQIDSWDVRGDEFGQRFDADGDPTSSWEAHTEGDVSVRERLDSDGNVDVRMTTEGDTTRTEIYDENGNTERVMVHDAASDSFTVYDDGDVTYRETVSGDGEHNAEARVEGVWFELGSPADRQSEIYGHDESGARYRMQLDDETGRFTVARRNAGGSWVDVAECAFDDVCAVRRPPCPYTCD